MVGFPPCPNHTKNFYCCRSLCGFSFCGSKPHKKFLLMSIPFIPHSAFRIPHSAFRLPHSVQTTQKISTVVDRFNSHLLHRADPHRKLFRSGSAEMHSKEGDLFEREQLFFDCNTIGISADAMDRKDTVAGNDDRNGIGPHRIPHSLG